MLNSFWKHCYSKIKNILFFFLFFNRSVLDKSIGESRSADKQLINNMIRSPIADLYQKHCTCFKNSMFIDRSTTNGRCFTKIYGHNFVAHLQNRNRDIPYAEVHELGYQWCRCAFLALKSSGMQIFRTFFCYFVFDPINKQKKKRIKNVMHKINCKNEKLTNTLIHRIIQS